MRLVILFDDGETWQELGPGTVLLVVDNQELIDAQVESRAPRMSPAVVAAGEGPVALGRELLSSVAHLLTPRAARGVG